MSVYFFLYFDSKLDHYSINPLKAEAKAPKASSAARLAALAETTLNIDCSIDLYSLNLVLDIQHKTWQCSDL